jgi:hypothetical protein
MCHFAAVCAIDEDKKGSKRPVYALSGWQGRSICRRRRLIGMRADDAPATGDANSLLTKA